MVMSHENNHKICSTELVRKIVCSEINKPSKNFFSLDPSWALVFKKNATRSIKVFIKSQPFNIIDTHWQNIYFPCKFHFRFDHLHQKLASCCDYKISKRIVKAFSWYSKLFVITTWTWNKIKNNFVYGKNLVVLSLE